jgi:hypothetical protein
MPNLRRLFWYEEDVRAWQAASTPVGPLMRRRRGRPTKRERIVQARTIEPLE